MTASPALMGIPCLECDRPVIAVVPERDTCYGIDEETLVVPDQTFSDSKGFLTICAECLKRSIPRCGITSVFSVPCFNRWDKNRGEKCGRVVLVAISAAGETFTFGGKAKVDFVGRLPLCTLTEVRCNSCFKETRHPTFLERLLAAVTGR